MTSLGSRQLLKKPHEEEETPFWCCGWLLPPAPRAPSHGAIRLETNRLSARPRRTLALGPPAVAIAPLLADPRLVHEPDLDILSRLLGPHRVDLRSEVFFNRYALTVRPIADSAPLDNAFRTEASSRDLRSCVWS